MGDMERWLARALVGLAIGCGGGDEEACEEANKVADEIRQAAMEDGIEAPCADPANNPRRPDEYVRACARVEELKAKCDG
jgi:hypothetical protein